MGSQTLEIIRQGVWASLTGGWFYDPHQNVFCNAIHLYLWLFLLSAPFVTYLYFPTTFTTWAIYCFTTTITITILKIVNMALHVLYDKAQAISDPNLKVTIKGSKESDGEYHDCGIEMQVLGNNDNMPSRTSVDQPINEVSEANSMMSINENITSTIDLKVDVHRKNSSESSDGIPNYTQNGVLTCLATMPAYRQEMLLYQQQHQLQQQAAAAQNLYQQQRQIQNDQIKRRYSENAHTKEKSHQDIIPSQYSVPIFKDVAIPPPSSQHQYDHQQQFHQNNQQQQYRKHHHHRNYSQGHEIYREIWRTPVQLSQQQSSISQQQQQQYQNTSNNYINTNNNEQQSNSSNNLKKDEKKKKCKTRLERQNSLDMVTSSEHAGATGFSNHFNQIGNRHNNACISLHGGCTRTNSCVQELSSGVEILNSNAKAVKRCNKVYKFQRHRSAEYRVDQSSNAQNILYSGDRDHHSSNADQNIENANDEDMINHQFHRTNCNNLGSSETYLAKKSYTKSELGIEQVEQIMNNLLQPSESMRKDSNSTMSALQLPVASSSSSCSEQQKTRRHSNTSCKPLAILGNNVNGQQTNVRRIKSAALEVACPPSSVSNLSPHPNSVEAIAGQQIKNPQSALLPPPSKCLVRNPHLNLCSKFGSMSSNPNDLKTAGIMEPVYPEETEADDKCPTTTDINLIITSKKQTYSDKNNASNNLDRKICSTDENKDTENDEEEDEENEEEGEENDAEEEEDEEIVKHRVDVYRSSMTESESEIERPQTQSTDSETDNNGSRSPLLNKTRGENNKSNRIEDIKIQKHQSFSNTLRNVNLAHKKLNTSNTKNNTSFNINNVSELNNNKNSGGGDSGCPSSDCEQISASSKDMLLDDETEQRQHIAGNVNKSNTINVCENEVISNPTIMPRGLDIAQEEADIENFRIKDAKSLGAIPKTVMRRTNELSNNNMATSSQQQQTIQRTQKQKSMSRTSSSASSRSFSAESSTNDIYKTYKDHYVYSGIGTAAAGHGGSTQNAMASGSSNSQQQNLSLGLPSSSCTAFGAYPRRTFVDSNYRLHHKLRGSRHNHYSHHNSTDCGDPAAVRRMDELSSNFNFGSEDMQKNCLENNTQQTTATTVATTNQEIINDQYSFLSPITPSTLLHRRHSTNDSSTVTGSGVPQNIYDEFPWHPCILSADKPVAPKRFYKYRLNFFGKHEIKIAMDRLQLLALFDRDLNWFHVILAIILSSTVCFFGAAILQLGLYKDVFAFTFCIVIAGSQYSLLKSVQPDAASPIHGFNKTVAYSRPIYFCICSGILMFSNHLAKQLTERHNNNQQNQIQLFGLTFSSIDFLHHISNFMSIVLLFFPLLFSLGLFPQINTFCMYFLEQIDMHLFGGNAACSLVASILCVLKSVIAVCILYGPAFGGLTEEKGTQHFLFSFFCALLIPIAYHLSRSASDFSHLWAIIKSSIVNTYSDDDDDNNNNNNNFKNGGKIQKDNNEKSKTTDAMNVSALSKDNNTEEESGGKSIDDDIRQNEPKDGAGDDLRSQQSKTICSTESKLDIMSNCGGGDNIKSDMTKINSTVGGEEEEEDDVVVVAENESTTATLSSTQQTEAVVVAAAAIEMPDPLPKKLQNTVNCRLKNDLVVSTVLAVIILSLHCSTVFTVLQPDINIVLYSIAGIMGFLLHYIIPQMRKHMPWLCFARPILRQKEFGQFEVSDAAKIMWFEGFYVYLCFLERNVLYPLIFISAMTADSQIIVKKFGPHLGAAIVSIAALKCVRNAYSDPANQYLILVFSVLLFKIDFNFASETFLVNYFVISILLKKSCDFLLKLQFIVTYIAPWQITWGSAFHAFAQPFSVPHSAMLFLQAGISAILSTPLNPFLGSAIFLTSYVRPIKFWERDYNTRRIDHSNTRLSSQLERDLGADDNNLNSIFYEHLTRSLQHSLCGDLLLGRWGNVSQGDCFVLASDYLNCLVHIIELGNGLCTFQMRGLEFRGTYCQQREVEAISEGVEDNDACCCCNPGHLPRMLSANAMFSTRWLAWQVVAAQYVLEGYSISENLATATLQVFEFRKVLITYYIKSIIYYVTRNPKLEKWLSSGPIQDALASTLSRQFVDLDIIFNYNLDEDFDVRILGITRSSFCSIYLGWIQFCYTKRKDSNKTATPATSPTKTNLPPETSTNKMETSNDTNPKNILNTSNTRNSNKSCSGGSSSSKTKSQQNGTESPGGLNPNLVTNPKLLDHSDNSNDNYTETHENITENTATTSNNNGNRQDKKKIYKRKLKFGETESSGDQANLNSFNNNNYKNNELSSITKESPLVSLCLALGLLARRSLATASHSSLSGVEFFLHGLHALFKGDFRITSPRDEWVFADMELLHSVVAPAVKMALKLHQDHFSSPDEYLDPSVLYDAITTHSKDLVISHEADPIWRSAVLRGAPNLLALRHVMEDGSDEYRIIRLTKRFLSFRVIKLNRECVRGLWAGQQQELIYLRNRNPERGSIQNAKQALRNIINSSCDQPIGYPIYVSPLTTSYADTNEQVCGIIGGSLTLDSIKSMVLDGWRRVRKRCREGCSSGSGGMDCDIGVSETPVVYFSPLTATNTAGTLSYGSQSLSGTGTRGSLASMNKPNSSTLLAGFLNRERDQEREMIREGRTSRKNVQGIRNDRDRRATLPITSSAMTGGSRDLMLKDSGDNSGSCLQKFEYCDSTGNRTAVHGGGASVSSNSSTPKISCSSGNLGDINNKYTITSAVGCGGISGLEAYKTTDFSSSTLRSTTEDSAKLSSDSIHCEEENTTALHGCSQIRSTPRRDSLIELNRKVIIVDGTEIYDCLDLGRRIDVVWPNEKMRANGGRSSWEDWSPQEGMVGYIRHFWQPNHPEQRYRSNVNRTLYLIEIGERFVPVGESGIREYNQISKDGNTMKVLQLSNIENSLASNNVSVPLPPGINKNMKRSSNILGTAGESSASILKFIAIRDYPSSSHLTDLDANKTAIGNNTVNSNDEVIKSSELASNITAELPENSEINRCNLDDQVMRNLDLGIFENISNNSTGSEDYNASDITSPTISENSSVNSLEDFNILKDSQKHSEHKSAL